MCVIVILFRQWRRTVKGNSRIYGVVEQKSIGIKGRYFVENQRMGKILWIIGEF